MLRVVTWNVNSVGARLTRVLAFLDKYKPDVVCLQELKCVEEDFPFQPIEALGYHCAVLGQKTYNGVAILSKTPFEDIKKGFNDGNEDEAARFIVGKTAGVAIASAYIPNGQEVGSPKFAYKLDWLQRLRHFFEKHSKREEPILLTGDFNVAPEDIDVYDPDLWRGKILFSDPERKALKEVVSWGFQDTFRKFEVNPGFYSWWDYRMLAFPKNHGLRIDMIYATPILFEKCRSSAIIRDERKGEKPSDHAPVLAEFDG